MSSDRTVRSGKRLPSNFWALDPGGGSAKPLHRIEASGSKGSVSQGGSRLPDSDILAGLVFQTRSLRFPTIGRRQSPALRRFHCVLQRVLFAIELTALSQRYRVLIAERSLSLFVARAYW